MSAPTLPLGHEDYAALAVGRALHALEPADQDRFEAHRTTCQDCEQEVVAALCVAVELAYGVPDLEPPAQLRERVLAVAEEAQTRRRPAELPAPATGPGTAGPRTIDPGTAGRRRRGATRTAHPRRYRRLGPLLAAAALAAVSAVTTWQVTRAPQDLPAPAATAERVATLSAPAGGSTVATVVVGQGRTDVVTDSLRPNAGSGMSYLLWGVPAGDAPARVVGSFEVTAPGLHSYAVRLVSPATGYPLLAISEEPAGTTPAEPGTVIARGALGH